MEGHIISAALEYFGTKERSECPDPLLIELLKKADIKGRATAFESVAAKIIEPYVHFFKPLPTQTDSSDGVRAYADTLLSLALLWAEFEDGTREGDGERVMRCWKFLLVLFKDAQRKNYAIEAFTLLMLKDGFLSPRQKEQLVWSRFVNYSGGAGANKAADLHMEHINWTMKAALGSQLSNITPRAVARAGQAAGPLVNIATQFDNMATLLKPSGKHTAVSYEKDLNLVVETLHNKAKVFKNIGERKHECFSIKPSPFQTLNKETIVAWMHTRLNKLYF